MSVRAWTATDVKKVEVSLLGVGEGRSAEVLEKVCTQRFLSQPGSAIQWFQLHSACRCTSVRLFNLPFDLCPPSATQWEVWECSLTRVLATTYRSMPFEAPGTLTIASMSS